MTEDNIYLSVMILSIWFLAAFVAFLREDPYAPKSRAEKFFMLPILVMGAFYWIISSTWRYIFGRPQ